MTTKYFRSFHTYYLQLFHFVIYTLTCTYHMPFMVACCGDCLMMLMLLILNRVYICCRLEVDLSNCGVLDYRRSGNFHAKNNLCEKLQFSRFYLLHEI